MKKKLIILSSLGLLLAPFVTFAANNNCVAAQLGTIQNIICIAGNILNTAIPIIIVLGIVYFVWGVITYVISSDEEAKKTGKNRMIWGIIGLVVIVAMWGLVGVVTRTFDLQGTAIVPDMPCVPGTPGC